MTKSDIAERFFLDTSIFMQIISLDADLKKFTLTKLTTHGKSAASYMTIIELNKYFLVLAIKMHKTVTELRDVPAALIELSNGYGRETNYRLILEGLVQRNLIAENKAGHYKIYAAQLETLIVTLQDEIYNMVNHFYGSFANHPIVKSRIYSILDFQDHLKIIEEHKDIDYIDVWKKNINQLRTAEVYFSKNKPTNKLKREVSEVVGRVLREPETKQNTRNFPASRHYGDLTVGLDSPMKFRILAHDHSFEIISESLGKQSTYISKIQNDIPS